MVSGPPALLELSGIRRHYAGPPGEPEVEVLRGLDLRIHAGEFIAIVGASGSGKSTLMHLLGCLDQASSGTYRFHGQDVAQLTANERAVLRSAHFGFVFQAYHLIPTESASENVQVPALYTGLGQAQRTERAMALLGRLGLGDKGSLRPHQLSGGQQQRVSIARALMNGGQILLADEPTGALDSESGKQVMALLHALSQAGQTIVLITHDRALAAQASRVIEIQDGRIVVDSGRPAAQVAPAVPALSAAPAGAADRRVGWSDLREAVRTAWRGMRASRTRTALTLLGIVIGVAAVMVMSAIGEGTRRQVMERMGSMGTVNLYLASQSPDGGGPFGLLTEQDLDAVRALPQIRRVKPMISEYVTVRHGNVSKQVVVVATSAEMPAAHHWPLEKGRYYTGTEDRELAPLAVLGHKARKHYFPDTPDPLGRQLLVGNALFEVIGVMAERGTLTGVQDFDEMVFIPYQSGRARLYQSHVQPQYVTVQALSAAQVPQALAALKGLLLARHGREDFSIVNAAAAIATEAATQRNLSRMLGLIAAVSLVVGGVGIMNVMLMSVQERTREIGIRVATGARQRDILCQFMTEAVLLTLVGGVIGILAGLALCAALLLAGEPLLISVSAMVAAFACAVATGLLFGYMPARTAARLDPVVALAGE